MLTSEHSDSFFHKRDPYSPELNVFNSLMPREDVCVSKQSIVGSDNGLWRGRRQASIWTNAGILSIEHLGTNLSETGPTYYTVYSSRFPFGLMNVAASFPSNEILYQMGRNRSNRVSEVHFDQYTLKFPPELQTMF